MAEPEIFSVPVPRLQQMALETIADRCGSAAVHDVETQACEGIAKSCITDQNNLAVNMVDTTESQDQPESQDQRKPNAVCELRLKVAKDLSSVTSECVHPEGCQLGKKLPGATVAGLVKAVVNANTRLPPVSH